MVHFVILHIFLKTADDLRVVFGTGGFVANLSHESQQFFACLDEYGIHITQGVRWLERERQALTRKPVNMPKLDEHVTTFLSDKLDGTRRLIEDYYENRINKTYMVATNFSTDSMFHTISIVQGNWHNDDDNSDNDEDDGSNDNKDDNK